jgi:DNA-binding response OmpR family regulator
LRILLVEDDRRIARFVAKGLREHAYAVEREHGKLVYSQFEAGSSEFSL